MRPFLSTFLFAGVITVLSSHLLPAQPPATRTSPTVDTYHGIDVADDYRWLEDWNDAEVQRWSEDQNAYAREFLDGLPVLLRTSANAGHGGDSGLSQKIEQVVDTCAFLFHHLGVKVQPPQSTDPDDRS
ncbi:hypothetical protein NZK35_07585 [Stieleria sp. ICT_E10.1]|uniref:hypothetical protein n=1 Tax=Stieleria sedimenti TaxID=2976331 RepID=UPI00217F995D|nr:hypothetical protein [Stieleria sedimenti]MCS7466501.1 hypothetical protein [Stieleria sedimenti]